MTQAACGGRPSDLSLRRSAKEPARRPRFRRRLRHACRVLYPDRPIAGSREDLLGRGPIADQVVNWIRSAPGDEGYVIGVTGAWGSGKSSVLNMVAERIADDAAVVRFDPWLFAGADDLVVRFFEELVDQLRQSYGRRLKKLGRRLAAYGAAVAPTASVIVGPGGQVLAAPDQIGRLADRGAARRRSEVQHALRASGERVVVMIDDIDRLTAIEVREVMRLVKLVADLPGVVHVLSYDRARVQQALGDTPQDGRAYLEKIVQASMSVPPVPSDRLRDLAMQMLDEAIGDREKTAWDREAWSLLVVEGLECYIETVRDARRWANVVPAVLDLTSDEVAAMDVMALEAVRVFDPDVHERLAGIADVLTGHARLFDFGAREKRQERDRRRLDGALAESAHSEVTRTVLARLFPAVADLLDEHVGGAHARNGNSKRVATRSVLHRYLHRALATGEAPSKQVDAAVEALANATSLDRLLAETPDTELDDLLDRLRQRVGEQPEPDVVGSSLVLLHAIPRMSDRHGFLEVPAERRAIWLVRALVKTVPNDRRREAAVELIDRAPTFPLRLQLLWSFRAADDENEPPRDRDLEILAAEEHAEVQRRLARDILRTPAKELADATWPFWLVSVVSEAQGVDVALGMLREPRLLKAVLESPGTELRPLSGGGVSLYLKPLVDIAGEPVLELLRDLSDSGQLGQDLNDALVAALDREPESP